PGTEAGVDGPADASDGGDGPAPTLVPYHALAIAVADAFACALRDDHSVLCWGEDAPKVSPPAGRTITAISAAGTQVCGILDDGSVTCWRIPYNPLITVTTPFDLPAGRLALQIAMSDSSTCILLDGHTDVVCTGFFGGLKLASAPAGAPAIREIAVGYAHELSVLYADGTYSPEVPGGVAKPYLLGGQFLVDAQAASSGVDSWCRVKRGGGTYCGSAPYNVKPDPTLPLTRIALGTNELCGIKTDGVVRCWGTSLNGCGDGVPLLSYWCDGQPSADHVHDVLLG